MPITFGDAALIVTSGVASHLGYFNRGEHHLYSVRYLQLFVGAYTASVTLMIQLNGETIGYASKITATIAGYYLGGLYGSLLIYRAFFHPLNKFRGPFGHRLSNFWFAAQLKNANAYKKLQKLHNRYGDFVRIGSSDISITHPMAVEAVYGFGSRCRKSAWYDLTYPMTSLQTVRQKEVHGKRRRQWSIAFSDKALRGYEDRMKLYRQKLVSQITAFRGRPINATKWFNLYSFDVMGDLAFAKSFNMLDVSEEHWAIKLLNEGIEPLAWKFPMWFFRLMVAFPGLNKDWWNFIMYCKGKLDERMKAKVDVPDIMSALLAPWKDRAPSGADLAMLQGDSQLIVVAGSDTTAATLTHIFYELCKNPQHILKVRKDISPYVDENGDSSPTVIHRAEHLTGVIYEALRFHPPVPSALERITPPDGLQIGDHYVPGDTTVFCPQYVIGRSENVFVDAHKFIPERWYSRPDLIKHPKAFAPFSIGAHSCIGRPLALLNIRSTVAKLLTLFDVTFAPGETGRILEEKTKDHFTLGLGELNLMFTGRD